MVDCIHRSSGESGEEDGGVLAASIMETLSDLDKSSEDQEDGSQGDVEVGRKVTDVHRQAIRLETSVAPLAETGIQEAQSPVKRYSSQPDAFDAVTVCMDAL